jgi:CheY-like chemotaxis protein
VSALVLVVDDEPDVADLFRQQFRKELRASRFVMEFAQSAPDALERVRAAEAAKLILILSDINMPGMSGPRTAAARTAGAARGSGHHDHRLWGFRHAAEGG